MKRKKTNSLIAAWKDSFSKGKGDAVEVESTVVQTGLQPKVPALALVRKNPVTFQLSRLENPKDFELMSFVVKACDKTAEVPFKTVLHVEQSRTGSRLVACDGLKVPCRRNLEKNKKRRLQAPCRQGCHHSWQSGGRGEVSFMVKGYTYNIVKRCVINLEKSGLGRDRNETENFSITFKTLVKQTGETVNLRHIEDLTKREWAVYCQKDGKRAIVLRQRTGKIGEPDKKSPVAVIMPIAQAA
jgi:hypothetical protein